MWSVFYRSLSTSSSLLRFKNARVPTKRRREKDEEVDLSKYREMKSYNPGIGRRLQALKDDGVSLKEVHNVDDSEADFFNFDQTYDEFQKDKLAHKELIALKMVKHKYFNDVMPNFLMWSEKELIRKLYHKDPELWTPEKIADSFPTTPEGAMKLVKISWKPASQSRIDRHDSSAMRNWKELKEGVMDGVPSELKKHVLKFSNRTIPTKERPSGNSKGIVVRSTDRGKIKEFSSIISKYENVHEQCKDPSPTNQTEPESITHNQINTLPSRNEKVNRKLTTLEDLRQSIEGKVNSCESGSPLDKLILSSESQYPEGTAINLQEEDNSTVKELAVDNGALIKSSRKVFESDQKEITSFSHRIRIPKKQLKIGKTYKVKDCYYDWDGRFLYRVPGMD